MLRRASQRPRDGRRTVDALGPAEQRARGHLRLWLPGGPGPPLRRRRQRQHLGAGHEPLRRRLPPRRRARGVRRRQAVGDVDAADHGPQRRPPAGLQRRQPHDLEAHHAPRALRPQVRLDERDERDGDAAARALGRARRVDGRRALRLRRPHGDRPLPGEAPLALRPPRKPLDGARRGPARGLRLRARRQGRGDHALGRLRLRRPGSIT